MKAAHNAKRGAWMEKTETQKEQRTRQNTAE